MIDTHAHLYYLKDPLETIVSNAKHAGVSHIINIAVNLETGQTALKQAEAYPGFISAALGVHPCDCAGFKDIKKLRTHVATGKYVAVGEIGLDYYHMAASKDEQQACFIQQLDIAKELNMPVVIHSRNSDDDMKKILKKYTDVKKVLHCYSSSADFALDVLNKNTYFSFTGMITFAKKGKVVRAIKEIPIEHIMIETDCPYMNPIGIKGDNEPANVHFVLDKIADIKGMDRAEAEQIIDHTSQSFFRVPKNES